jgi:hypothetical protein
MSYIYESPDGGKTVYRRTQGSIKDRELVSIDPEKQQLLEQQVQWDLWKSILHAAKTNSALSESLDRARILYELSRCDNH